MVEANFNNDAYIDKAEVTSPTTLTVSLGSADGYTVSAILTAPKNQSFSYVNVYDYDGDGNNDVYASASNGAWVNWTRWLGNGDGTFDSPTTGRWNWQKVHHSFDGF